MHKLGNLLISDAVFYLTH